MRNAKQWPRYDFPRFWFILTDSSISSSLHSSLYYFIADWFIWMKLMPTPSKSLKLFFYLCLYSFCVLKYQILREMNSHIIITVMKKIHFRALKQFWMKSMFSILGSKNEYVSNTPHIKNGTQIRNTQKYSIFYVMLYYESFSYLISTPNMIFRNLL